MSDKNPCPFCGDESEYLRFLDLCAERANKIWRENEVKILTGIYKSMDFIQVVRCRDCKYYGCYDGSTWCSRTYEQVPSGTCDYQTVEPDGFCAWGERS